jgi:hypothetical protein
MLASYEREKLQAELARGILDVVQTGERDLLQVTNRAIRRVRERILVPKEPPRVTQLTATSADRGRSGRSGPAPVSCFASDSRPSNLVIFPWLRTEQ